MRDGGGAASLSGMSTGNDERPLDEGAERKGADIGAASDPADETTFEPEEDPDAVENPETD